MNNNHLQPEPDAEQLSMELEAMEVETATSTPTAENPPPPEQEAPPTTSQPRGMKLILEEHKKKLKANWPRSGKEPPVVKIFNPTGSSIWLIHSMDPHDEDTLFGLCDHGFGFPELGYVSLSELQEVRPKVRVIINGRAHGDAHLPGEGQALPAHPFPGGLRRRGPGRIGHHGTRGAPETRRHEVARHHRRKLK